MGRTLHTCRKREVTAYAPDAREVATSAYSLWMGDRDNATAS